MSLSHAIVGAGASSTLLLHGFLGSGRNLSTLARRLVEKDPSLRIVLPDLPGHGSSPRFPDDAGLAYFAAQVLATAREAGVPGPYRIIGHSLGGRVGLRALLDAPGEVASVTLLDITPSPIVTPGTRSHAALSRLVAAPAHAASRDELRLALVDPALSDALVDWLMMNVVREGDGYGWRLDRRALEALHPRVNAEDLWPAVERRVRPVRCIRGEHGGYVSDADAARLEAAGCPVDTLAGAGHFVHVDALEPLVALL